MKASGQGVKDGKPIVKLYKYLAVSIACIIGHSLRYCGKIHVYIKWYKSMVTNSVMQVALTRYS